MQQSHKPLELLIDSTEIQFLGEGESKRKKHGTGYQRQWRKVHLDIDAETLDIYAIEVTDNKTGDSPILPNLLRKIDDDQVIANVRADGAYDTRLCRQVITDRGA